MELTAKEILESQVYQIQKAIIHREIHWGASDYIVDQRYFKKSDEEKALLANMRAKWLKNMRAQYPNFTKRNGSKKQFRQTLTTGEDI